MHNRPLRRRISPATRGNLLDRDTCLRACTRARGRRRHRPPRATRTLVGARFRGCKRPPRRNPRQHERRRFQSRDLASIGRRACTASRLCRQRRSPRNIRPACACMPLRRCTLRGNPGRPLLGSLVRRPQPDPSRAAARTKKATVGGIGRGPGTPLRESSRPRWPRTCLARRACRPRFSCSARTRGNPWTSWQRNARGPARDRGDTRLAPCTRRTRRSSSPSRRSTPSLVRPRGWCACRTDPAAGRKARSCSACSTRTESHPCPPRSGTFGTRSRESRAPGRAGRPENRAVCAD